MLVSEASEAPASLLGSKSALILEAMMDFGFRFKRGNVTCYAAALKVLYLKTNE